ncbi:MAG: hypothetical protein ACXAD7_03525 [Candidatus Kariarchaeaceae archaeon]
MSTSSINFHNTSANGVNPSLNRNLEFNYVITFVNYNQGLIDINSLQSFLPDFQAPFIPYDINYEFSFANTSYQQSINNYVDTISSSDWTSKLNTTALEEQKLDFGRKKIFEKQNGTAIDARKLELFLDENRPTTTLENNNLFFIYVLNFSRFDAATDKHWFNATEVDPDSMKQRFYWRLEWDYPLNYDVKFPYAAFSEQSDIAMIDPTAFQWYLYWRAIWNRDTEVHDSYIKDLSELIKNESANEQKNIVTDTLKTWLYDWITNIYGMVTFPLELDVSVDVQLNVIYDALEEPKNKLEWIINEEFVSDEISYISQSTSITVNVNYISLQDDAQMVAYLESSEADYFTLQGKETAFKDWKYYYGEKIWYELDQNSPSIANYFSESSADILVKGLIFLLDNASYAGSIEFIPWSGGLYTGIGGNQVITILWELDRAFMPDRVTHKSGLSKVLVHEIGHSIGLPHTFTNRFTSDFSSDVMGYYPGAANFSKLVTNAYWRNAVDNQISLLYQAYDQVYADNLDVASELLILTETKFNEALTLHSQKEYVLSYKFIKELIMDLEIYYSPDGTTTTTKTSSERSTTQETNLFLRTIAEGTLFIFVLNFRRKNQGLSRRTGISRFFKRE